jgi:hypothetical protein
MVVITSPYRDRNEPQFIHSEHSVPQHGAFLDLAMKHHGQTSSNGDRAELIGTELARLFQQQIELTRREALVGLTPAECEEYENIVERIRESYIELAKVRSGP